MLAAVAFGSCCCGCWQAVDAVAVTQRALHVWRPLCLAVFCNIVVLPRLSSAVPAQFRTSYQSVLPSLSNEHRIFAIAAHRDCRDCLFHTAPPPIAYICGYRLRHAVPCALVQCQAARRPYCCRLCSRMEGVTARSLACRWF